MLIIWYGNPILFIFPGEYILKDDLVDNLNIKDEIAKDLGLKDEITSALDQHEDSETEKDQCDSGDLLARAEDHPLDKKLTEESDSLLPKLSENDGSVAGDFPSVSLEEALRLVGLDETHQVRKSF